MPLSFRAEHGQHFDGLVIRVIGYRQTLPGAVRTPHERDWFCAVFHDPVPVLLEDGWRDCAPGALVISPPGVPIGHGAVGSPFRRSWVRCAGSAVETLVAEAGLQPRRAYGVRDARVHDDWLLALHRECQHPLGADGRIARDLLSCWWRAVRREQPDRQAKPARAAAAARDLIEARYLDALGLDGIAATVGVSRTQLCRSFRQAYNVSPMAYVQRLRMAHAEDLLRATTLPVGEVAERSGFRDLAYFSRAFRHVHGCTPSSYRRGA